MITRDIILASDITIKDISKIDKFIRLFNKYYMREQPSYVFKPCKRCGHYMCLFHYEDHWDTDKCLRIYLHVFLKYMDFFKGRGLPDQIDMDIVEDYFKTIFTEDEYISNQEVWDSIRERMIKGF